MGNKAVAFIILINRRPHGKTYTTIRVERFVNKQSIKYL